MTLRTLATTSALSLALLTGLSACASGNKHSESLKRADDIVTRIERVHVECELSKERAHDALGWLQSLVTGDYQGDALTAYTGFVKAVEASEKQADTLRSAVGPMQRAAEPFFDGWETDLNAFTNPKMRRRSQVKLGEARRRYQSVAAAVEPAQTAYDAFNMGLKDIVLFLSHDFNAVHELKREVRGLLRLQDELDQGFDRTLVAAKEYIASSALPVGVEMSIEGEDRDDG